MMGQQLPMRDRSGLHSRRVVRRVGVGLLAPVLALLVACGFGGPTPAPTPVPTAAPIPRPTAEPAAAVAGWYAAALTTPEGAVRVRADLTQHEIDRISRTLARRYPELKIDWTRGSDVELLRRTLEEHRANGPAWDVYVGESAGLLKSARATLHWTPPEARTVRPDLIDGEGAWYAVAATYRVLQYNTELVPAAHVPRAYEQLLDPGYYGRLALAEQDMVWLKGLEETRGPEAAAQLLRNLARQGIRFRPDPRTLVSFVTAGEHAVGINSRLEPVVVQPLAVAVSAASDRPHGARVLANYLLSIDVQEILAEHGRVPSRTDVDPEPQTLVRGLRTHVTLPPEPAAERDLRQRWSQLLGRR
jgi:iron(III) transport system substrate-binding protein